MTEIIQAFDIQMVLFPFHIVLGIIYVILFFLFLDYSITLHFRVLCFRERLLITLSLTCDVVCTNTTRNTCVSHGDTLPLAVYPVPSLSWAWALPSRRFWSFNHQSSMGTCVGGAPSSVGAQQERAAPAVAVRQSLVSFRR